MEDLCDPGAAASRAARVWLYRGSRYVMCGGSGQVTAASRCLEQSQDQTMCQCWFDAGPTATPVNQHQTSIS